MSNTAEYNIFQNSSPLSSLISSPSSHKPAMVQALPAHLKEDIEEILNQKLPNPVKLISPMPCATADNSLESLSSIESDLSKTDSNPSSKVTSSPAVDSEAKEACAPQSPAIPVDSSRRASFGRAAKVPKSFSSSAKEVISTPKKKRSAPKFKCAIASIDDQCLMEYEQDFVIQLEDCSSYMYKNFDQCLSCTRKGKDTCRFKLFRMFKPQLDGSLMQTGFVTCAAAYFIFTNDFMLPATDDKLLKLPGMPKLPSLEVAPSTYVPPSQEILDLNSRYVMSQVKEPLLAHLSGTREFLKAQPTVFYRKPLGPICQTCDVCRTGIFSAYCLCRVCGSEVCLTCYANWDDELKLREGLLEHCSHHRIHTKKHFIPVTNYLPERLDAIYYSTNSFIKNIPPPTFRDDLLFKPNEKSLLYPYLNPEDLTQEVYQSYWQKGQPILMKKAPGEAMHQVTPKFFIQNYGKFLIEALRLDGSVLGDQQVAEFFQGFDDPKLANLDLKIKDFPSGDKFSDILPSLNQDFMNQLPVQEYMSYSGSLNLISLFSDSHITPDLGPKMYVAYTGTTADVTGTTQLHLDAADAINILKYHSGPAGAAGAIWHLFRQEDANTIREFIRFKFPDTTIYDPIHDQSFYLTDALLEELFTSRGVKPFIMEQQVGEVVLIPAGCPHQVRNMHPCIKLAMDYVSPEAASICSQLAAEFRLLPQHHRRNVDILNAPTLLAQAWNACMEKQYKYPIFRPWDVIMPTVPKEAHSDDEPTVSKRACSNGEPTAEAAKPKKKAGPKKSKSKA
ncbi:hypothetical protein DSO57_1001575 [Entomophthora muscae]|uniref:Uncharacterized protein n=1 Tax=Entomophthora muscae TaxID=34485 RepID=A0ACC2SB25_9FUNG|nr:hypothetical protein DSO57_1001575 [Entomophthora muscae]